MTTQRSGPLSAGDAGTMITCRCCGLFRICFARRLGVAEGDDSPVVERSTEPLRIGEALDPDHFRGLSVLRSGALKRCRYTQAGDELIAGFYFPGETLGFELDAQVSSRESLVALETAHVCNVSWPQIESLMDDDDEVRDAVNQMLREELTVARERLLQACRGSARQRVAAFLLDLAARRRRQSLADARLRLSMGRREIAAYLDLTIETISRTLSQFKRSGLIELEGRRLRLVDESALASVAAGGEGERLCG